MQTLSKEEYPGGYEVKRGEQGKNSYNVKTLVSTAIAEIKYSPSPRNVYVYPHTQGPYTPVPVTQGNIYSI